MVELLKISKPNALGRTAAALSLGVFVTFSVAACQPEPTSIDDLKDGGNVSEQVEGETTWGGGQGPEYTPNTEFPASFPRNLIPLADGDIVDVGERDPGVWFVNINVSEIAALDDAVQKLQAAGFTVLSDQSAGADRAITLQSDRFDINLLSISGDGIVTLSYDVTTRG